MRNIVQFLMVIGMVLGSSAFADVSGTITFDGKAKKQKKLKMKADPVCNAAWKGKDAPRKESLVVDESSKGLANVFVEIKGAKGAAKTTPVEFDQHGCIYVPHVVGVMVGQPLAIINSDTTLHNVHSLPKKNPSFNMGMATKGQKVEKTFAKAEKPIKFKCDVHGWMNAYVIVTENPFFAVSGENGKFAIAGVPDGEYEVEAWHETLGTKSGKLKVAGGAGTVDFAFSAKS